MPLLVSIHAPWEGCDQHLFYCEDRTDSFNSRTLGRVRPLSSVTFICASMFQFTHPGKGATVHLIKPNTYIDVSIHAPWEGCDRSEVSHLPIVGSFNSRTLGRVRLVGVFIVSFRYFVSIHAPWEGCDSPLYLPLRRTKRFQFTHPGKGATHC